MLNWAKKAAGLKDEIYGPEAIHSVATQTATTPYTVTTRDDHKWQVLDETNVETKTFYVFTASGHIAMFQVIYSSLLGMKKTATVNTKLFTNDTRKVAHWDTDELKTWKFSDDKTGFTGEYSACELSADGTTYTLKIQNSKVTADLTFTQAAPGVKLGKDGTTIYGLDPAKPMGRMVHNFWPRCKVTGTLSSSAGVSATLDGSGMYLYALQGMKPHFAASKWNFFGFAGPTHNALMMEFITPPSYGDTRVSVGVVAKDGAIVLTGTSPTTGAVHTASTLDKSNKLPEPTAITYTIGSASGKGATAVASGPLGERMDRIDIMGELPALVKQIAISASGTTPYIYQYGPDAVLDITGLNPGDEERERGRAFMEATFIARVS